MGFNARSDDSRGMPVYPLDGAHVDAFERIRISEPITLFDGLNQYNDSPLFFETTLTGGGTSTHLPNESSVRLSVTTASGDKVIRQSREYFRYTPGKSQLILMSNVMGAPKANTRQRLGYFDASNGLFFENNGSTFGVVQRSKVSGSVVDTRVAQSAFNIDKLDGTGLSRINIDLSKANVFVMDFEWLGVGRVRMGVFDQVGRIQYCHEFVHVNTNTTAYSTTACLPLRWELENTGTAASETDLRVICCSVITEDGAFLDQTTGLKFSASNGTTTKSVTSRVAVLSIEPKATFNSIENRGKIANLSFEIYTQDNPVFYEIIYGGTLGGTPSFNSVDGSSIVEYDTAGTTVTGGIVIDSGYVPSGDKLPPSVITRSALSKLPLVLDSTGANPIKLTVVVTSLNLTAVVGAALHWTEVY